MKQVDLDKIHPDRLLNAVVCYLDSTIGLPIITSYGLARHKPRKLKRLSDRSEPLMKLLIDEHSRAVNEETASTVR